jgi:hypothetical protein
VAVNVSLADCKENGAIKLDVMLRFLFSVMDETGSGLCPKARFRVTGV